MSNDQQPPEQAAGCTIKASDLAGSSLVWTGELPTLRFESGPVGYRLARRRSDGQLVLQSAHQWTEGPNGGIVWRDTEIVEID